MTLTEFLLARIAEDEAEVQDWPTKGSWGLHSPGLMWTDPHGHPIYAPRQRVLAECEAKRRIVTRHRQSFDVCGGDCSLLRTSPCPTLQALASVYADHPDYRADWRV